MQTKFAVVISTLLLFFAGCATPVAMLGTDMSPAAQAEGKLKMNSNENVSVHLKFAHLAPSERLNPPRSAYIVWAQTAQGRNFNLGKLNIEDGAGEFNGQVPTRSFRILVSAEDDETAKQPGSQIVLKSEVMNIN